MSARNAHVIIVTGADPLKGKGGGTNLVRSHARAALQCGHQVHVFCLSDRDETVESQIGTLHRVRTPFRPGGSMEWGREMRSAGSLRHFTRWFLFSPYAYPLQTAPLARAIMRHVGTAQVPVILHTFWLWGAVAHSVAERIARTGAPRPPVAVMMYTTGAHELAGKLRGLREAGPRHAMWWLYRVERAWQSMFTSRGERRICTGAQALLFDFESSRQLVTTEHGDPGNTRMIASCPASAFDPVDYAALRQREPHVPGEPPLIVTVSRHDGRKGIEVLLRALDLLRREGTPFRARIGSGGELLARHRRLAVELGLEGHVSFTGWLDDPNELLAAGDIFVLPSLEEGSGSIALVEAMRAGLPIVASRVDGIPESIEDGKDGILVEPADPQGLAQALRQLLNDGALRRQLGTAVAASYTRRHSPEALVKDLAALYRDLLGAPRQCSGGLRQ